MGALAIQTTTEVPPIELDRDRRDRFAPPILKVMESDPANGGRHSIYGLVTAQKIDQDGERCIYKRAKPQFQSWSDYFSKRTSEAGQETSYGNVRIQHDPNQIGGKVLRLDFEDQTEEIYALSEPTEEAFQRAQKGLLTGYSPGGRYEFRKCAECGTDINRPNDFHCPKCQKRVVVDFAPVIAEISYVDNPCLKDATFTFVRADGTEELRKLVGRAPAVDPALENPDANGTSVLDKAEKETPKAPYGEDVDYADPGYQGDKQKRYPIDTEQHIRAAWNYIHQEKNAAQYSGDQVSNIKSRIVAAWKKKIDKDGPPAAAAKVSFSVDFSRIIKTASAIEQTNAYLEKYHDVRDGDGQWSTPEAAAKHKSAKANEASNAAYQANGSHARAADLHNSAGDAHMKLAQEANDRGDTQTATGCAMEAQYHRIKAASHKLAAQQEDRKLPKKPTIELEAGKDEEFAASFSGIDKTTVFWHSGVMPIIKSLPALEDSTAELRKYSEDQERDEHGRWASDGGATGSDRADAPMILTTRAERLSREAGEATADVHPNAAPHVRASIAHRNAAQAHTKAMKAHQAAGNRQQAMAHRQAAKFHTAMAKDHRAKAERYRLPYSVGIRRN